MSRRPHSQDFYVDDHFSQPEETRTEIISPVEMNLGGWITNREQIDDKMNKQRLIDFSFSHCPFYSVGFSNGSSTSGDITQIYWTSTKGADKPGGFIVLSFLLGVDLEDNDRGKIWIGLKRRHPLAIVSFHSLKVSFIAGLNVSDLHSKHHRRWPHICLLC